MLTLIILILAISFILYAILGGADFGAGIVELFAGSKGEKTISKSIAPVWEANHVWLILAIVILFTGFPKIYSTISTALHIPLMIVLIGIVLRGTSFTFRHYDDPHVGAHKYYSVFFKVSSFVTPFFLGVILGAMILGRISTGTPDNFYEGFIAPWLNVFCFMMGLFTTALFAYIASVFLIGEAGYHIEQKRYGQLSKLFLLATIVIGFLVFIVAEWQGHHLFAEFMASVPSVIAMSMVLLVCPLILFLFTHPVIVYLRVAVATQVTLIMLGWFSIQFPIVIYTDTGQHLTFYNTQAPQATLIQLLIALIVGLILVVPAFYFLFKVFKKTGDSV